MPPTLLHSPLPPLFSSPLLGTSYWAQRPSFCHPSKRNDLLDIPTTDIDVFSRPLIDPVPLLGGHRLQTVRSPTRPTTIAPIDRTTACVRLSTEILASITSLDPIKHQSGLFPAPVCFVSSDQQHTTGRPTISRQQQRCFGPGPSPFFAVQHGVTPPPSPSMTRLASTSPWEVRCRSSGRTHRGCTVEECKFRSREATTAFSWD